MYIILELIKSSTDTKVIGLMDEEGFLITFKSEEQAQDYIDTLGDADAYYQITKL